jgi:hypothetical protein
MWGNLIVRKEMQCAAVFEELWCHRSLDIAVSGTGGFCYEVLVKWKRNETEHGEDIHQRRHRAHTLGPTNLANSNTAGGARGSYNNGLFGFDRSFPENPALINASLNAGINSSVKIQAARVKPRDACRGWPSLLRIKAAAATRPERVNPHRVKDPEEERDPFGVLDMVL